MSRLDVGGLGTVTLDIPRFGGLNNAVQFSQIDITQSPKLMNLLPGKTFSLKNRPGTAPYTNTAASGAIARLPILHKSGVTSILATVTGSSILYKLNTTTLAWDAQTMTNVLATPNIGWAQFRDEDSNEVLVIADGGNLKYYNGTTVANIAPAADDTDPLPDNELVSLNTDAPPVGVTVHNNRLVIWGAGKDQINHSKPGYYDYFPATSYQRFVRENDTIVTCRSFASALIVFMKRHVAAVFGDGYSSTPQATDWSQDFLDTSDGCVNAQSVQQVLFPDGRQEIFYQTDRGVSSVHSLDTKDQDNSTRIATRSVTNNKVDWTQLGITNAEWAAATSYFYEGNYWLIYKQGTAYKGLVFSTLNEEWYPVENIQATDFYGDIDRLYFSRPDGHLANFDDTIYKDYTDKARTTGTNVEWYWHSKLLSPQMNGFSHLWDIVVVESKQFTVPAAIDIEFNTLLGRFQKQAGVKLTIMIVGITEIGVGVIANRGLTDFVTNGSRIRVFEKGEFGQLKLHSNRGEPVELYDVRFEVRTQQHY